MIYFLNDLRSTLQQKLRYIITRCTRGDACSFFLYLQNVFVCTKKKECFMNIFKYCLKNYIKLNEFATQLIMMYNL